jgi:hypothetical protein
MGTKTKGKGAVVALAEQLIAGTAKHLANGEHVMLLGSSLTPAQVTEELQAIVNLRDDVDAAKALTKAKLAVEIADMPARRIKMDAFVRHWHHRDVRHCRAPGRDDARWPECPCDQHGHDSCRDAAAHHVRRGDNQGMGRRRKGGVSPVPRTVTSGTRTEGTADLPSPSRSVAGKRTIGAARERDDVGRSPKACT